MKNTNRRRSMLRKTTHKVNQRRRQFTNNEMAEKAESVG